MRDKKLRQNPIKVDTEEYVTILTYFYKLQKFVTLMADAMFVNRTAFLINSEIKIKFTTVKHIPSQTSDQLSKILNKAKTLYGRGSLVMLEYTIS